MSYTYNRFIQEFYDLKKRGYVCPRCKLIQDELCVKLSNTSDDITSHYYVCNHCKLMYERKLRVLDIQKMLKNLEAFNAFDMY